MGFVESVLATILKYRWWAVYAVVGLVIVWMVVLVGTGAFPVLKEPFFGGIGNITLFGIPIYGFIIPLLIIIIAAGEGLMRWLYWGPFEYLHGIYQAFTDKVNACFIGDLQNRYELIAENKAKLIHPHEEYEALYDDFFKGKDAMTRLAVEVGRKFGRNYDMMIAKELEPGIHEAPAVHGGGIPIDIIFDFIGVSYRDSPARKECIRCTDAWNALHPENEIYTYYKFWLNYDAIDREVQINHAVLPKTVRIPMARIKAALPPKGSDTLAAGYPRQLATDLENAEDLNLNKYTILIIGFFVFINIVMWAMRMMHVIGHH